MSNTDQSRVEFEKWAEGELQKSFSWMKSTDLLECIFSFMDRNSTGEYRNLEMRGQFKGWLARDNEIAALRDEVERLKLANSTAVDAIVDYAEQAVNCDATERLFLSIQDFAESLK